MTVGELADEYGNAGVGAANLHEAVDVTEAMFDDDVTGFFGLAGAMVPRGMRAIVAELIRDGYINVLVTTGANLTHDSIEAIGGKHHHGAVHAERKTEREHDETLRDEGVDRIYNVYLPQEFFANFESHLREEVFPVLEAGSRGQADEALRDYSRWKPTQRRSVTTMAPSERFRSRTSRLPIG